MRIAVLFYGRINWFRAHYDRFLDVFGIKDKTNTVDFFLSSDAPPIEDVTDFIELYKPIAVATDPITYTVDLGAYPVWPNRYPGHTHNMTCHFINLKRVFGLLEEHRKTTGATYDIIVSSRLDLGLNRIPFVAPETKTVYIPAGEDHTGINDRFAFGDFESMRDYMHLIDNAIPMMEKGLSCPHPETLTKSNLEYCGLKAVRFPCSTQIGR